MKSRFLAIALAAGATFASAAHAQSADDLNLQFHGYATQGFVYTNHNSWNTTDSSNGSAAWTEAVTNFSAQPDSKLRLGAQARFFLLGDYGNTITLDWAQGDYQFNDHLGLRFGKVKSPTGLFNESQDIDPAHVFALLPQSIYPLASRNTILAHFGLVLYGSTDLGESGGKLEYRAFGGMRQLPAGDAFMRPYTDAGFSVPNGLIGPTGGGSLRWRTPLPGLLVGASAEIERPSGELDFHGFQGTFTTKPIAVPSFFLQYEHKKFMVAAEANRMTTSTDVNVTQLPEMKERGDDRGLYVMATYHLSNKLSFGTYYSQLIDKQMAFGPFRSEKDWDLTARYDFNPFAYLKLEQHFVNGGAKSFDVSDNPNMQPHTSLSILKLGVSF